MRHAHLWTLFAALGFTVACGGSYPPPNERMATSESAVRGAQEVGAQNDPKAALYLKLAQEEIDKAKGLVRDGENKKAEMLLLRADADAELALAVARQTNTRQEAQAAQEQVKSLRQGK